MAEKMVPGDGHQRGHCYRLRVGAASDCFGPFGFFISAASCAHSAFSTRRDCD
jgi:hypothetical protein